MSENIRNRNFIEQIIDEHNERERFGSRVHTRFPPEPNGYLHIGHAKSICLNFGIAQEYKGKTNLRFDDTNPVAEDTEYVDAIREDVKWLGFDWEEREFYASDYFQKLYDLAVELIKRGKAYVDDSTAEEVAEMKGTPTVAGTASKYRNRSIEENLTLLEGMKNGDFPDGARVLRAKIDLTSPNMHLRDPLMYRIKNVEHHRTGDAWHIYPMYDFAHGISDSIEGVTHSICTLEFEVHRPLYEWFLEALDLYKPQQIEFARLNLSYTIMSKRRLKRLVEEGYVNGWDDPRMPTISGLRRRGYTPASIRLFAEKIGVARRENIIDVSLLEFCVKEDLNKITDRVMAVLNPLKVTITNYPEGKTEEMEAINNPGDESAGSRIVPFSRELYIERTDFLEDAPRKFFRLSIGKMVRLKNAYIIQCDEAIKDENGEVIELKCSYIENSRSGEDTSGLKVKGTIHWVSIPHAVEAEVRLYDRLFTDESPNGHKDKDFLEFINPESLEVITGYVEPHLKTVKAGESVQFMRIGYFAVDKDTTDEKLVFNRTVALRDNWKKKK
jgi:glutaminyl-tRNA synthetase